MDRGPLGGPLGKRTVLPTTGGDSCRNNDLGAVQRWIERAMDDLEGRFEYAGLLVAKYWAERSREGDPLPDLWEALATHGTDWEAAFTCLLVIEEAALAVNWTRRLIFKNLQHYLAGTYHE